MFANRSIVVERHLVLRYFNRNCQLILNYFVSSYFDKKKDSNTTVLLIKVF